MKEILYFGQHCKKNFSVKNQIQKDELAMFPRTL